MLDSIKSCPPPLVPRAVASALGACANHDELLAVFRDLFHLRDPVVEAAAVSSLTARLGRPTATAAPRAQLSDASLADTLRALCDCLVGASPGTCAQLLPAVLQTYCEIASRESALARQPPGQPWLDILHYGNNTHAALIAAASQLLDAAARGATQPAAKNGRPRLGDECVEAVLAHLTPFWLEGLGSCEDGVGRRLLAVLARAGGSGGARLQRYAITLLLQFLRLRGSSAAARDFGLSCDALAALYDLFCAEPGVEGGAGQPRTAAARVDAPASESVDEQAAWARQSLHAAVLAGIGLVANAAAAGRAASDEAAAAAALLDLAPDDAALNVEAASMLAHAVAESSGRPGCVLLMQLLHRAAPRCAAAPRVGAALRALHLHSISMRALAADLDSKAWAAAVAAACSPPPSAPPSDPPLANAQPQTALPAGASSPRALEGGATCLLRHFQRASEQVWLDSSTRSAMLWLDQIEDLLVTALPSPGRAKHAAFVACLRQASPWSFAVETEPRALPTLGDAPHPTVDARLLALLASLLAHDARPVRVHALRSVAAAALVSPAAACELLPCVLAAVQRACRAAAAPEDAGPLPPDAWRELLCTLAVLPLLPRASALDAFFFQVVHGLVAGGAGARGQALGVRMLAAFCLRARRGWKQLGAAVAAFTVTHSRRSVEELPAREVRLAVGAALADVAACAPEKAPDMIAAMQATLHDADDGVAALAMEALARLCHQDVLDLYGAWKVVHASMPRLPDGALLGQQWLHLLGAGALDALAHPEKAAAILEILWRALAHSSAPIRAAAARALSRFELELQEQLEAQRPLSEYVRPLLSDAAPEAVGASEALALAAVRHEYDTRRRLLTFRPQRAAGAAQAETPQQAALRRRLAAMLPARLLAQSSSTAAASKRSSRTAAEGPVALELAWLQQEGATAEAGAQLRTQPDPLHTMQSALRAMQWSPVMMDAGGATNFALSSWRHFFAWCFSQSSPPVAEFRVSLDSSLSTAAPFTVRNAALAIGACALYGPQGAFEPEDACRRLLTVLTDASAPGAVLGSAAAACVASFCACRAFECTLYEEVTQALDGALAATASDDSARAGVLEAAAALHQHALQHRDMQRPGTHVATVTGLASSFAARMMSLISAADAPEATDPMADALRGMADSWPLGVVLELAEGDVPAAAPPALHARGGAAVGGAEICALGALAAGVAAVDGAGFAALVCSLLVERVQAWAAGGEPSPHLLGCVRALPQVVLSMASAGAASADDIAQLAALLSAGAAQTTDGAVAAAALVSQALLYHGVHQSGQAPDPEAVASLVTAIERILERSTKMTRRRHAAVGAAAAAAVLLAGVDAGPLTAGSMAALPALPRSGLLLERAELADAGKRALRVLEGASADTGEGSVAEVASWLLAACCRSVRTKASGAADTSGSTLRPLDALPETGALHPLASYVLSAASTPSTPPPAAAAASGHTLRDASADGGVRVTVTRTASALSCLARAPWIPLVDWSPTFERVLRWQPQISVDHPHDSSSNVSCPPPLRCARSLYSRDRIIAIELRPRESTPEVAARSTERAQAARAKLCAVNMACMHGGHAGVGLADCLESAIAGWAQLPRFLQLHVLCRLDSALPVLSHASQARVLRALAAGELLRCARASQPASEQVREIADGAIHGETDSCLLAAACVGLAACLQRAYGGKDAGAAPWPSLRNALSAAARGVLLAAAVPHDWSLCAASRLVLPEDVEFRLVASAVDGCGDAASDAVDAFRGACALDGGAADEADGDAVLTSSSQPWPEPPCEGEVVCWTWAALWRAFAALPAEAANDLLSSNPPQPPPPSSASTHPPPDAHACPQAAIIASLLVADASGDADTRGAALLRRLHLTALRGVCAAACAAGASGSGVEARSRGALSSALVAVVGAVRVQPRAAQRAALIAALEVLGEQAARGCDALPAISLFALVAVALHEASKPRLSLALIAADVPHGILSNGSVGGHVPGLDSTNALLTAAVDLLPACLPALLSEEAYSLGESRVVQLALFDAWSEGVLQSKAASSIGGADAWVKCLGAALLGIWELLTQAERVLLTPLLVPQC